MISRGSALGTVVTSLVHGALAVLAPSAPARAPVPPPPVEVTLDAAPPPPPPADEPPPPAAAEPAPAPPPPAAAPVAKAAPKAAPAEPARQATVAEAGKALVADSDGDIADFSLVTGSGASFAGGTTSSTGTSREPGRAGSTAPAVASASRPAAPPPAPAVDRSRPARPGAGDWNCSHLFPSDEDAPDSAAVSVVVTVRPDGSAASVAVVSDPGHGFGPAARRCAMGQRFEPALDVSGQPTTAPTRPFTVRFRR